MTALILKSLYETLLMVGISCLVGIAMGLPLAVLIFLTSPNNLWHCPWAYHSLSLVINALRSIPYIILIVLLIPLTRLMVGSSIGLAASIVPLSLASILLMSRFGEDALRTVPRDLIEMGLAMGASHAQIVFKILLQEALPRLAAGSCMMMINIIGYSAMAGAVGGGGLGDLAIRYGYQRYDVCTLLIIVALLIGLVQLVQTIGDALTKKLTH
jgi:D-methionine transport system permease protein